MSRGAGKRARFNHMLVILESVSNYVPVEFRVLFLKTWPSGDDVLFTSYM